LAERAIALAPDDPRSLPALEALAAGYDVYMVTDASGAEQRIRAFGSLLRADGGVVNQIM